MFGKLMSGLAKTRQNFVDKIRSLFTGRKIDDALLAELEEILITSDIGVAATGRLLEQLKAAAKKGGDFDPVLFLKEKVQEILSANPVRLDEKITDNPKPYVILVIGVNGVGKTTTIAKLGGMLKGKGKNVVLAAGDTFRAAAIEQLDIWAKRTGVDIVKSTPGGDPSSVIFDAITSGIARGADVVIADTAGRLHTKYNLMEELKKMCRVANKAYPGAPHEIILILDATIGQNAISQAKIFNEAVKVTGLVLTKLDGTSKGGVIIPIVDELKLPIYYIGVGEKEDDLINFDPASFTDSLFS